MEKEAAVSILRQLANGVDPHTGEVFAADSPYQHPDTVRALFLALHELNADAAPRPHAAARDAVPQNRGKPWAAAEDQALAAAFDAGRQIPELAAQHQRSRFAIEARLAKLGKIAPPANMRVHRVEAGNATYSVRH